MTSKMEATGKVIVPEFKELTFEDSTHTYRLDGVEIPSVTTVMQPLSEEEYGGINQKTLEKAANKGSSIHNSIENFIKYDFEDVNPEYRGYFDGFLKWWREEQPEVVGSEIRVYHKVHRYAGTIDLLVYLKGKLTLIDVKTTYNLIDMLCAVQLEGYAQALASHGIVVDQKIILHLKKDGSYAAPIYAAKDALRLRVFNSLKIVYDYIKSSK